SGSTSTAAGNLVDQNGILGGGGIRASTLISLTSQLAAVNSITVGCCVTWPTNAFKVPYVFNLRDPISGYTNVDVGFHAGLVQTGANNVRSTMLGSYTGQYNVTNDNTAAGYYAFGFESSTIASQNTAYGYLAAQPSTLGPSNTSLGAESMENTTIG